MEYASPGASLSNANVLIVFDGAIYVNRIPTPTILDNLYAEHRIGPTIAIFVDNGGLARSKDYHALKGYRADYVELPGDHEPVSWRRALPQGLIATLKS